MIQSFYHRRINYDIAAPQYTIVTIYDDGADRQYDIKRSERAAFKHWAMATFAGGMNCKKLVGTWPVYEVRQPS